jgi:hypothetical protein
MIKRKSALQIYERITRLKLYLISLLEAGFQGASFKVDEIKELIDSANRGDLTPQEFASKLGDLYYKNVNGLEG